VRLLPLAGMSLCACAGTAVATRSETEIPIAQTRAYFVPSSECYSLSYRDPKGGGEVRLFPKWIVLYAGADSGRAYGREYPPVATYHGWKRRGPDSVVVDFTGPFEGVRIRAARDSSALSGRANWLTDLVGYPEPSMSVTGRR